MMYKFIMIVLLSGVALTSCKIGKEYTRPELGLPDRIEAGVKADSASVSDLKWWDLYT